MASARPTEPLGTQAERLLVDVVQRGLRGALRPAVGEHVDLGEGLQAVQGGDDEDQRGLVAQQRQPDVAQPRQAPAPSTLAASSTSRAATSVPAR